MPPQHILIAGGGLAGPTLALALRSLSPGANSFKCTILERRDAVESKGGVIMLAPNAMRVMQMVGLEHKLREEGHPIEEINIHTDATPIGSLRVTNDGIDGLSIARPDLHHALIDKCQTTDGITVRHGARVGSIEENDKGVTVQLENGEEIKGDAIIGCDGIGSAVRKHILGDRDPKPIYNGFVVVGCFPKTAVIKVPPTMKIPAFIYTQHGTFLSFMMDRANTHMVWGTTPRVPERDRRTGWDEYRASGQAVRDVKQEFKHVTEDPIRNWVDALDNDNVWVWAPYTLPELPTWHSSRATLTGDAAHAFPPSIGQGTAQSFEDVGLLARILAGANATADERGQSSLNYAGLFAQYESIRKKRTTQVRNMALSSEKTRGKSSTPVWWLKSSLMWALFRVVGQNGTIQGDFLNGYDVTKEPISV